MTTSTNVATFVDTNVLVYARDEDAGAKQGQARRWLEHLWHSHAGRLSTQVLQEYYVTVTRTLSPGLPQPEARQDVADLSVWRPVVVDADLIRDAWEVEDRFGFSFWDALIVAGARAAGCEQLLTEDLSGGQDLDGLEVVNPFEVEAPG